ncbi:MAG: hypothetical protein AAB340_01370 [Patescibacteria group bacterium]
MKKVLVVNDNEKIQSIVRTFGELLSFAAIQATSLKEGKDLYDQNQDVDLIVMDGSVDNNHELDSIPLVKEMRKTYEGPILAASSNFLYNEDLIRAGCSHKIDSPGDLIAKIRLILGIE